MRPHLPHSWRNSWLVGMVNLAAVLVLFFGVPVPTETPAPGRAASIVLTTLGAAVVGLVVLREFRRHQRSDAVALSGLHLFLLMEVVLVGFSLAYYVLAQGSGQFSGLETRLDALYYTATTMTTVGYGDIHPTGQVARAVVTANLGFNVVFLAAFATLAARRLQERPWRAADET